MYTMLVHNTHICTHLHTQCRPVIESKNMRFQLLNEHRPIIGNTRAFDGVILYLPKKITDTVGAAPSYPLLLQY